MNNKIKVTKKEKHEYIHKKKEINPNKQISGWSAEQFFLK